MSRIGEELDALLTWIAATPFASYCDALARAEVDLADYEAVFALAGFPIPSALRELVGERGLIGLPRIAGPFDLPGGQFGLSLDPPESLFANYVHHCAEQDAGVGLGRHWLVFATIGGDLEGAWALDDRFGGGASAREYGVGWYHQDEVCEVERGLADPLPGGWLGVEAFFCDLFARGRAGFERALADRSARAALEQSLDELSVPGFDRPWHEDPRSWRALLDDDLDWNRGRRRDFRTALAHADDLDLVAWILSEIDRDLAEGSRRPVVPGIRQMLEGGLGWPWDYPGPRELVHRLPIGAWTGPALVRWAIELAGPRSEQPELARALAMLDALAEPTPKATHADALAVAIELAELARRDARLSPAERSLAWALVWSLGRPTPAATWEALERVLQFAKLVRAPARAPLDAVVLHRKLAAIVRGKPDWQPKSFG
ncbi:hypothetical protein ACNOYE_05640 [Nannocystaceae bacterium ST9]